MKLFHRKYLNQRGFGHVELFVAIVFIAIVAFVGIRILNASHAATDCVVSSNLVNSCRPWQGDSSNKYPGVAGDLKSRISDYEARTGTQVDFAHNYVSGAYKLSSSDLYYINRANTYELINYKPASGSWGTMDGSNASVNSNIKTFADSIKSVSPKKVMVAVWHEPQNDVSGGSAGCGSSFNYVGNSGTPAQYVAMWHNVRNIFKAEGVDNAVFSIIYMGDPGFKCMDNDLYPGDSSVDWVMWDKYLGNGQTFQSGFGDFYSWLTANSNSAHNYLSHPWGIGEWGSWATSQSTAEQQYSDGGKALQNNTFPNIKLWTLWDSNAKRDSRIGYDSNGNKDQTELSSFITNWAKNPAFSGKVVTPPPPPAGDVTPPTVSITSPTSGAKVSGTATISVSATDNVGVTRVVVSSDGTVIRDATSQGTVGWGTQWDTTKVSNGSHTVTVTAYDAAGNKSGKSVAVTVANGDTTAPTISITSPVSGAKVSGTAILNVTAADNTAVTRVVIVWDGNVIRDDTSQGTYGWGSRWDTSKAPNGTHTITATAYDAAGNTKVSTITVTVKN